MVRLGEGDAAAGRSLGEQAVALARKGAEGFCLTIALASYGVVLLALEHYDDARAALEESSARGREGGDLWAVALPLRNLAIIAYRQQDYHTARTLLEDSLRGLRAVGESAFLSRSMETLAEVMAAAGEDSAPRTCSAQQTRYAGPWGLRSSPSIVPTTNEQLAWHGPLSASSGLSRAGQRGERSCRTRLLRMRSASLGPEYANNHAL